MIRIKKQQSHHNRYQFSINKNSFMLDRPMQSIAKRVQTLRISVTVSNLEKTLLSIPKTVHKNNSLITSVKTRSGAHEKRG
jgi:hypothetical protein